MISIPSEPRALTSRPADTPEIVQLSPREWFAGIVVWACSGTPLLGLLGSDIAITTMFLLQLAICFRFRIYPKRVGFIFVTMMLLMLWLVATKFTSLPNQEYPLLGQLTKLMIVGLPLLCLSNPIRPIVEVMVWICRIAIGIFTVRQIVIIVGFDIAHLFDWFYDIFASNDDRSIIIFNFDNPSEATRNAGPFVEPGMFAANVAMASILLLFPRASYTSQHIRKRLLLFIAALVSAQSTMGLLAIPLLTFMAQRHFFPGLSTRLLLGPLATVAVGITILAFGSAHKDKIELQFEAVSIERNTWYNTRFGNAYIDWLAIEQRPFIGFGFDEKDRIIGFHVYAEHDHLGLGNGLTGTVVKFGIPFSVVLYIIFLFAMIDNAFNAIFGILAWAILGILLFSQQLLLHPAAFILLGYFPYRPTRRQMRAQIKPPHKPTSDQNSSLAPPRVPRTASYLHREFFYE